MVLGKTIEEWITYGSKKEDDPMCRASNHFHNPGRPWKDAGLTDTFWLVTGWCYFDDYQHNAKISGLTWATGCNSKSPGDTNPVIMAENKYDWDSAREYLYTYLTGRNFLGTVIAQNDESRQRQLAKSMRALGQVLHMIQDIAVPARVRNDFSQGHLFFEPDWPPKKWCGNPFERYVEENDGAEWFDSTPARCAISAPTLTDFWDTNDSEGIDPSIPSGFLGLSEYTQANFFSEFRMFTPDFPYPREEDCVYFTEPPDDSFPEECTYLASTNGHPGEQINHLAVVGCLESYDKQFLDYGPPPDVETYLTFDNKCYNEYASKLIPRAIGYSADLLDYFFRGRLQVKSVPIIRNNFVYGFFMYVKNATLTEEELSNGMFSLSVRYTPRLGDPDGHNDIFIQAYDRPSGVLQYGQESAFVFTLSEPLSIEDLESAKCMLAFKGKLGLEEQNAVIGKIYPAGQFIFAEEWDHGLEGNSDDRLWYHSPDQDFAYGTVTNTVENRILVKENKRLAGFKNLIENQSFICTTDYVDTQYKYRHPGDFRGIPITPNSYVQFKIDDFSINEIPPAPPNNITAYQYLLLGFNAYDSWGQPIMGHLALYFTQNGQAVALPYINDVTCALQVGAINIGNIYDLFESRGMAVPKTFHLHSIELRQYLHNLADDSTIEHRQRMAVDFISVVEGYNEY